MLDLLAYFILGSLAVAFGASIVFLFIMIPPLMIILAVIAAVVWAAGRVLE